MECYGNSDLPLDRPGRLLGWLWLLCPQMPIIHRVPGSSNHRKVDKTPEYAKMKNDIRDLIQCDEWLRRILGGIYVFFVLSQVCDHPFLFMISEYFLGSIYIYGYIWFWYMLIQPPVLNRTSAVPSPIFRSPWCTTVISAGILQGVASSYPTAWAKQRDGLPRRHRCPWPREVSAPAMGDMCILGRFLWQLG